MSVAILHVCVAVLHLKLWRYCTSRNVSSTTDPPISAIGVCSSDAFQWCFLHELRCKTARCRVHMFPASEGNDMPRARHRQLKEARMALARAAQAYRVAKQAHQDATFSFTPELLDLAQLADDRDFAARLLLRAAMSSSELTLTEAERAELAEEFRA